MIKNDKKSNDNSENKSTADHINHDKHNPFNDIEGNENEGEPTPDKEAIAEQQRKETLTERD